MAWACGAEDGGWIGTVGDETFTPCAGVVGTVGTPVAPEVAGPIGTSGPETLAGAINVLLQDAQRIV